MPAVLRFSRSEKLFVRSFSEDGVRYAFIASIENDASDVDFWTPVAT